MRSSLFFLSASWCLSLLMTSCSVEPLPYSAVRTHKTQSFNLSDRVSLAEAYYMAMIPTKGADKNVIVEPIVDPEGDTLMYFVNYANGWKILSADKRTPAVIAESEVGSISLSTDNHGLLSWLGMTATDMKHIIHSEDSGLNFTADQISSHRQQWSKEPTRFQGDSLPILPYYNEEWGLQSVATSEIYYSHIDHLVAAHWDQGEPYNHYCPPKSSGGGNKPVGCTPVACGQLFQHLCSSFGIQFDFTWNGLYGHLDNVVLPYSNPFPGHDYTTALYLRYLGATLGAIYQDDGTSVVFSPTRVKDFLSDAMISCTKQDYSATKVKQNLLNGMPVFVTGYRENSLGLPNYFHGHSYIIDGYKLTRTETIETYTRFVGYPPILEERYDTTYSSPHIDRIKMNWGWADQWTSGTNDDWFALTGDWYVNSGYSYTEDITILCDFALSVNN